MAYARCALILAALCAVSDATCPTADGWADYGGSCLKVPTTSNPGSQIDCVNTCQSAAPSGQSAALTCVNSESKHQAIVDWLNAAASINGIQGRRSTRYFFWIGNYQPVNGGPWSACVSGEETSFTSWSPTHTSASYGAQPDDGVLADGTTQPVEDCAGITADGWYDQRCNDPNFGSMYCLCELGLTPSAEYTNYTAHLSPANVGSTVDPLRTSIGLTVAVVLGLLAGLISCLTAKKADDWKARVKTRTSRAMLTTGWVLVLLGLAPIFMLVIGQTMFFSAVTNEIYFLICVPVGIVCFMLSVTPSDVSGCMVPAFFISFYALVAVITAAIALFLAGPGGFLQIISFVWLADGLLCAIASASTFWMPRDQNAKKLLRLWLTSRVFLATLGVTFIVYGALFPDDVGFLIACAIFGVVCLLLSGITTPRCRSAFCIWIATLGLGGAQIEPARGAARIVFCDLTKPMLDDKATSDTEMGAK